MWIIISIAVLLVLLGVAAFLINKNKKSAPDYYSFFVMGLIWAPFGIIMKNYAFFIMGIAFMIIGLYNKDKWRKNRQTWNVLDERQKKIRMAVIIMLGILVLAGACVFYFRQ